LKRTAAGTCPKKEKQVVWRERNSKGKKREAFRSSQKRSHDAFQKRNAPPGRERPISEGPPAMSGGALEDVLRKGKRKKLTWTDFGDWVDREKGRGTLAREG